MKQCYRIAVRRRDDHDDKKSMNYVIRNGQDLDQFLTLLRLDILEDDADIELIKWVPIPALEEV